MSPSRSVKTATSAIIGGLLRRFPSGNSSAAAASTDSPPSAGGRKTLLASFGSSSNNSAPSYSSSSPQKTLFSTTIDSSAFDEGEVIAVAAVTLVSASPKANNARRLISTNALPNTNLAKVHSVQQQQLSSLEEKFELLMTTTTTTTSPPPPQHCHSPLPNVSLESEALAKGSRLPPASSPSPYSSLDVSIPLDLSPPAPAHRRQQPRRDGFRLQDFELGVTLGTGSFGRVKHATLKRPLPHEPSSGLAVKMLDKSLVKRQNQVEHILHEKQILAALSSQFGHDGFDDDDDDFDFDEAREPWMPAGEHGQPHPFIVRMFGTFQTDTYLFMALEYVPGGEFFTHLRMRGHFKNHEAMFYASSVGSVFAFLHSKHVAYRDLKPENLLLDHQGYVKVVDFGFAKRIPDNKTFTLCGTPDYIAPEVLMNMGHGKGVDWWALGVLTYEMLSGVSPFTDVDTMNIYKKICKGLQAYPSYFEPEARSFIRRLLQVDVKKRYGCLANGAEDVLMHRWLFPVDHELLLARKLDAPFVPPTAGLNDTSCFEDYPHNPEDDCLGEELKGEDADFPGFSTVCW